MFDRLPMDVINYEIRPLVANDYFARVGINEMVRTHEKTPTRLRRNAAAELEVALATARMKPMLNDAELHSITYGMTEEEKTATAERKAAKIGVIFDFNVKHPILLKHNLSFRTTVESKVAEFADPDCPQYHLVSEASKATLIEKATWLMETLANNPFLFHVNGSTTTDKWSPIDGAPACVIVDNSVLLAAAAAVEQAAMAAAEKERRSTPHWRPTSYRRRGRYMDSDEDDYDDDDWQYGYYEDGGHLWVCLKTEAEDNYERWSNYDEPEEQPKVSRRGTVMEADGWERVVSRRREWY